MLRTDNYSLNLKVCLLAFIKSSDDEEVYGEHKKGCLDLKMKVRKGPSYFSKCKLSLHITVLHKFSTKK